jgi:hypothetical protein
MKNDVKKALDPYQSKDQINTDAQPQVIKNQPFRSKITQATSHIKIIIK